ncbi:hypothetical protein PanWU01x14_191270 [Parasponia andersonii]|uniref:HAT, C-terminal dimerization domain containing protein n=1 Tax=Parasponia andersonii TaxID=3476 RepID=A0A2P5C1Y8_PARAD|nr:hypothetical protein PanWU01x14_191270 [Parasponia andersonii]
MDMVMSSLDLENEVLSPITVETLICLKNWLSASHQPIVMRDYMDEVEVFEISEDLQKCLLVAILIPPPPIQHPLHNVEVNAIHILIS